MKKYVLVVELSAGSSDKGLYVQDFGTIKAARHHLAGLNLRFESGFVYCAVIGRRVAGSEFLYEDILRTGDGYFWTREGWRNHYNPSRRDRLEDWSNIDYYRKGAQL